MNLKKFFTILTPVLFFLTLAALALITAIMPKEDFSELENRYLEKAPDFTFKSWLSGQFQTDAALSLSEHFALRPRWISLRTALERISGHNEVNGVYISDGAFYEAVRKTDYDRINKNIASINSFAQKYRDKVSVMLVPTSAQIYADHLPDFAPEPEQRRTISYVYTSLAPAAQSVDVYDALYRAREDYIYYRTDHHWTTRGAYTAYCEFIQRCGYEPVSLDKIDIEHASHTFKGSYYSKILSDEVEPDTVDIYTSGGADVTNVRIYGADGAVEERDSVYFRENLEKKDKYLTFLGENVPKIEIESQASGGSILIIKDSYANCFAPFLTKHFSKVTLVDLRYMMKLSDYVNPSEYDRVLILYNVSTFEEEQNLGKLELE